MAVEASVRAEQPLLEHRWWLRQRTEPLHALVEQRMGAHDPADPAGYRRFLSAQWRAVATCEKALMRISGALSAGTADRQRRTVSLRHDMSALAIRLSAAGPEEPPPLSAFAGLGLLYVLEGSRLGARVLARRLQTNPCSLCRSANRFLSHGGEQQPWRSFLPRLNATATTEQQRQEMFDGATFAFAAFLQAAVIEEAQA